MKAGSGRNRILSHFADWVPVLTLRLVLTVLLTGVSVTPALESSPVKTADGGFAFYRFAPLTENRPQHLVEDRIRRPVPDSHSSLVVNPPTFRWPVEQPGRRYEIQLSAHADFPGAAVHKTDTGFFRPLLPLPGGTTWWRYRVAGGAWSQAVKFEIPAGLVQWPIPAWATLMSKLPQGRPRIFIRPAQVGEYQRKARGELKAFVASWARNVDKQHAKMMKRDKKNSKSRVKKSAQESNDAVIQRRRERWAVKSEAKQLVGHIPDLAWLWMLTGDEQWAVQARNKVLAVTRLDVNGSTSSRRMDFANATIMSSVAIAYDMLYEQFSPQERRAIRAMLMRRAAPVMESLYATPQHLFRAHGWQRTFLEAMIVALALYDEEPQAELWLEAGLRRFIAFYPWFGGADGGSSEGANYFFSTDLRGSLRIHDFFYAAFGVDFAQHHPWYRNAIYYVIYSYPPNQIKSLFGDSSILRQDMAPSPGAASAARHIAELQGNGFATDYADRITPDKNKGDYFDLVRWLPYSDTGKQSLAALPESRVFRDVGVVFMHSDISSASDNVRFEFRSSPYGAAGHAHADQNSFNIIAANQPLATDSGYYDSYGSDHHKNWTTQTAAHNTILVDGTGQDQWGKTAAYGRIVSFIDHDSFTYILGDAGTAYLNQELKRFDRHVIWLKGKEIQTYIIVDDLQAADDREHRFDWLLHADYPMQMDESAQHVEIRNMSAKALVSFVGPKRLKFSQTDAYSVQPKSFRKGSEGKLKKQWHFTATAPKANAMTFVSVVQVGARQDRFPRIVRTDDGFTVDRWRVRIAKDVIEVIPGS